MVSDLSYPASCDDSSPVCVGSILRLRCLSLGYKGDGIFRLSCGFVIIVPGTLEGHFYELRVTRVFPNLCFGKLVKEIDGSTLSEV